MKELIPVFKPLIEADEIEACSRSLANGWLGMGSSVGLFENEIKSYLKADDRHVVAVSTGHAAIHLGLLQMGVGPGDEVITPSFNNVADFQAILATGATPVFCDINPETLCIDIDKAEELVTKNTKAVIIMDYDCILCDYEAIEKFSKKYGIRIFHDAAHSFGSSHNGRKVGSFSDVCMFSFDPVKTITCIDGGILVVRSEEEKSRLHELRLIGMSQPSEIMYKNSRAWTYDVKTIGYRYHMANLHAALGLTQLSKIDDISLSRRQSCKLYSKLLQHVDLVKTPKSNFEQVTPFLYYILVPPEHRDPLREYLKSVHIDTGIHWQSGHKFTLFSKCKRGDLTNTEAIASQILSLPLHSMMPPETINYIAEEISKYFEFSS